MKKFLTEADKKKIISDKEKAIIESFAKTFNKIKRIDENQINEIDDDFEKDSRESEYGMNPYKNEELFVIDYNEDGEDIIVQTSDRVTEKYHYVTHEVEGVSPNDATVFITFANDDNTREIIAKTNYTGGDVLNFDNLNFVSVKNTIN